MTSVFVWTLGDVVDLAFLVFFMVVWSASVLWLKFKDWRMSRRKRKEGLK